MSFLRHNAPLGVKLEQCGGREEGIQDTGWKYRSHILKGIIAGDRGRAVRAFCGFYVLHSGCMAYVNTSAASNIRRLRRCEVGISLAGAARQTYRKRLAKSGVQKPIFACNQHKYWKKQWHLQGQWSADQCDFNWTESWLHRSALLQTKPKTRG